MNIFLKERGWPMATTAATIFSTVLRCASCIDVNIKCSVLHTLCSFNGESEIRK